MISEILDFLQKHYAEVVLRFSKFQRPVDFEPKLTHVKRMLDEIEERMHLIEVRSEEPETLQAQLDTCMVGIREVFCCGARGTIAPPPFPTPVHQILYFRYTVVPSVG